MEEAKHFLGFEHFRTDLGDGIRTGVYFDSCTGNCFQSCAPKHILKEHPFAQDTKERRFYLASELISYLVEEKSWCHSKPLGITFLGKEPLSDPIFCRNVASAIKKAGMRLDIWTCGTTSKTAFDLLYGVADLFVFNFLSPLPNRKLLYQYSNFDKILDNLFYLDEKMFSYRVRVPVMENVNTNCAGAISAHLAQLKNVRSVILDFSNCSLSQDERKEYRKAFLKHNIVLY